MARYIDADELKNAFTNWREIVNNPYDFFPSVEECKTVIDAQPTADVAEVKRGRWIRTDAYPHRIYCSNCYGTYALDHWGIWIDGSLPRVYCPNCGSRMDLDGDTE